MNKILINLPEVVETPRLKLLMPKTMLKYAMERLPKNQIQHILKRMITYGQ